MKTHLVYDVPTRVFHALFGILFLTAFLIANLADDDAPIFSYHMLAGLTLLFILGLRIVWGMAGSTYARFSAFMLHPRDVVQYFRDILGSGSRRYTGHNPASSWAAIVMFAAALILGVTGIMMARGGESDIAEELHEIAALVFLLTTVGHIAGLILHHVRHRDGLWRSMVTGFKHVESAEAPSAGSAIATQADTSASTGGIRKHHYLAGTIFVVLTAGWMLYLGGNYNAATGSLQIFWYELQLGESDHYGESDDYDESDHYRESD
jgi:cytochrome b